MAAVKTDRDFLRIFLVVSALMGAVVGTSVCCARIQKPRLRPASICGFEPINPNGVRLDVPVFLQQCNWCWATDVAMIGTYYGRTPIRPCDLVTATTTVAIVTTSTKTMPAMFAHCCIPEACQTTCNHGGNDAQIRKAFEVAGYPHAVLYNDPALDIEFSEFDLQLELSSNRPVMIVVMSTKPEADGSHATHVRIVSGFTPATPHRSALYRVIDSNERHPFERSYDQLRMGDNYLWYGTWTLTASAAPECQKKTP